MIKLGRGSTLAAAAVSLAPYAVCALLLGVFVDGYLAALARYLRARSGATGPLHADSRARTALACLKRRCLGEYHTRRLARTCQRKRVVRVLLAGQSSAGRHDPLALEPRGPVLLWSAPTADAPRQDYS